jgi:hypothetical protein
MTFQSASIGPPARLSTLTMDALAEADARYPKWATMCQLRRIGLPVLDAVLITPGQDRHALDSAIAALVEATGQDQVLIRSDGGTEARRYYKGGNTFPAATAASKAAGLLEAGRAVIVMEPTNRFTNRLTALLRMDRVSRGGDGTFTIEALGPGYDAADLTRGGISPQVTVTATVDWSAYPDLWWSYMRMTTDMSQDAEEERRGRRLARIAADVLTDTGHLAVAPITSAERAAAAEVWLRERGHDHLWAPYDIESIVARRARRWFDDAFMIAACHPERGWTCLASATSDLGGRAVFWDIVDGSHKYAIKRPA